MRKHSEVTASRFSMVRNLLLNLTPIARLGTTPAVVAPVQGENGRAYLAGYGESGRRQSQR